MLSACVWGISERRAGDGGGAYIYVPWASRPQRVRRDSFGSGVGEGMCAVWRHAPSAFGGSVRQGAEDDESDELPDRCEARSPQQASSGMALDVQPRVPW